jgi:phosphatidylglycerophosphatase GEP4
MVGDRYLTDIVYGNLNGMLTIRPAPFTLEGETTVVKGVRAAEDFFIARWRRKGIRAPDHPLVPSTFESFQR